MPIKSTLCLFKRTKAEQATSEDFETFLEIVEIQIYIHIWSMSITYEFEWTRLVLVQSLEKKPQLWGNLPL